MPDSAATSELSDRQAVVYSLLADKFRRTPEAYASGRLAGWMNWTASDSAGGVPLRWSSKPTARLRDGEEACPTDDIDDIAVTAAVRGLPGLSGPTGQPPRVLRRVVATSDGFRADSGTLELGVVRTLPSLRMPGGGTQICPALRYTGTEAGTGGRFISGWEDLLPEDVGEYLCSYSAGELLVRESRPPEIPVDGRDSGPVIEVSVVGPPTAEAQEQHIANGVWWWTGGRNDVSRRLTEWAVMTADEAGESPQEARERLKRAVTRARGNTKVGFAPRSLTEEQAEQVKSLF